jgi:3-dehydroquinate dehydratase-1
MKSLVVLTLGEDEIDTLSKKEIRSVDILEIRLDLLKKESLNKNLVNKLKSLGKRILFTYRQAVDSSMLHNESLEFENVKLLLNTFNSPKNFLDIELDKENKLFSNFPKNKYKIIHSVHKLDDVLNKEEILSFIKKRKSPGGIYKFAVTPKNLFETGEFLIIIKKLSKKYKIAGVCMGEFGLVSRLFPEKFGSSLTYCCLKEPRAPGQIPISVLEKFRTLK